MLDKFLLAFALMAVCVALHAVGMITIVRWLRPRVRHGGRNFWISVGILIRLASWTIILHISHIFVWGTAYAVFGAMPDFKTGLYFSAVTYTTTGYGDLVLTHDWRVMGAIEALTGILMCGLSASMFFSFFSQLFALDRHAHSDSSAHENPAQRDPA